MAKKSKSSVKAEPNASGEEETIAPVAGLNIPTPSGGIIDFYYLFGGIGILMGIVMIMYLLNRYVFHIL